MRPEHYFALARSWTGRMSDSEQAVTESWVGEDPRAQRFLGTLTTMAENFDRAWAEFANGPRSDRRVQLGDGRGRQFLRIPGGFRLWLDGSLSLGPLRVLPDFVGTARSDTDEGPWKAFSRHWLILDQRTVAAVDVDTDGNATVVLWDRDLATQSTIQVRTRSGEERVLEFEPIEATEYAIAELGRDVVEVVLRPRTGGSEEA